MTEISLIAFTGKGAALCSSLVTLLSGRGRRARGYYNGSFGNLSPYRNLADFTGTGFKERRALIFIGAAGIAVRAIAPFVRSKAGDPAVIVLDEKGEHVIPLLSGHLGGANDLAVEVARLTGGKAVITTATI